MFCHVFPKTYGISKKIQITFLLKRKTNFIFQLNSDGKLDEESALAHLEKMKHEDEELYNTLHGIFQKCYGELHDESDPCETALKLGGCMKSKANDVYFSKTN